MTVTVLIFVVIERIFILTTDFILVMYGISKSTLLYINNKMRGIFGLAVQTCIDRIIKGNVLAVL